MEFGEFVDLVADMRIAQRAWFNPRTRSQVALDRSKALERRVDEAIRAIRDRPLKLFAPEESDA